MRRVSGALISAMDVCGRLRTPGLEPLVNYPLADFLRLLPLLSRAYEIAFKENLVGPRMEPRGSRGQRIGLELAGLEL
jgi:hypothetical protein